MSISSSAWVRGYDTSGGHPVGAIAVSYDLANGAYVGGSASALAGDGGIHPHELVVYGGYATAIRSGLSVDVGAARTEYSRYATAWPAAGYSELYASISGKLVTARLSFSPDYFQRRSWVLYSELDGHVPLGSGFTLSGHAGLLSPLRSGADPERTEADFRVGIVHSGRRLSFRAELVKGAGYDDYGGRNHRRRALVLGMSYAV